MAKTSEVKAKATRTNKTGTNETTKAAPIMLEFLGGDSIAVCDAETGVCTVPNSAGPASEAGEQQKPAVDKRAGDCSEPSAD